MNAIELIGINKTFKDKVVLNDIHLNIEEGKMVAITGGSGSGKTTLLNMIGLIEKPTSGQINIFDIQNIKPNSKKAENAIRYYIGYLFQNHALIDNETVENNLKIGLKYVKNKKTHPTMIKNALKEVGLEGYEKRKVFELSGGEQQRVAIARIMLKPSKLILADEPTGSLDPTNRNIIIDLLKKLNQQGKTVLIVTHDQYVADSCDQTFHIPLSNLIL